MRWQIPFCRQGTRRHSSSNRGQGKCRACRPRRASFEPLEDRRLLTVSTPSQAEFLIIAADNFVDEAQPLAHWKHIKGYPTYLAKMSEVGTTDTDVFNFISDAYENGPETSYVLLVGDHENVPGHEIIGHSSHGATHVWHTDYPYACVEGGDLLPDLAIGRLPGDTEAQITTMVEKVMGYDRTPDMGDWYDDALVSGYFQDYEDGEDPLDGTAARMFMETAHRTADFLGGDFDFWGNPDPLDAGYTVHTALNPEDDSYATYHYQGWGYPGRDTPPDPVPTVWTDLWTSAAQATADITTAVNGGVSVVFHRDHGSTDGWGDPPFHNAQVNALTNGDMLPVVFSINCQTGRYDDAATDCYAETWMRKSDGGAVGVVAPPRNSQSGYNDALTLAICDGFWDAADDSWTSTAYPTSWRPSEVLNRAKVRVLAGYGGDDLSQQAANMFNYFGEPEMMLRTETPVALDATFPCMVFQGHSTDLTVTVTRGGVPIAGSLVCISHASADDYWVGTTNLLGEVTFVGMTTSEIGAYSLVASAHDSVPYEGILYSNGPDQFELNDTICTATVLGSLPKITLRDLSIHSSTDVDLFQYTAQDTGKTIINVFFNPECGDVDMRVKDIRGNVIAEATETSIAPLRDMAHVVIPVVSQEMYFIEVYSSEAEVNAYHLEIENFAAPIPDAVVLDPADDEGWSNSDNLTCVEDARIFIEADLFEFDLENIDILTPAEVAAQEPGAAVEVFVNGNSVGYATPISGTGDTLFQYTFEAGELSTTFIPTQGGGGLNFVKAAVRMFDGQQDAGGLPDPADGRTQLSEPLLLTLDVTAPAASTPDLLASSDTGAFDDDNVTKINQPALTGVAEANARVRVFADGLLVGEGMVGKDATDGDPNNGLGLWEITVEPLDDGIYDITTQVDDPACNLSELSGALEIEIDTVAPNTPFLDLLAADDSGRSNEDDVTNDATPRLDSVVDDPDGPDGHRFTATNIVYRIFDRYDTQAEALVKAGGALHANGAFTDMVDLRLVAETQGDENDGHHNLKLEVEDRAGNLSEDYLLDILLDRVAPPVTIIDIDPAATDTGIEGQPWTFVDRITSDTATGFFGRAEADAIVRLYADDVSDDAVANPAEYSLTVAVPEDGNVAFPNGQWNTAFIRDLNDPNFFLLDGIREILVTAEDVAGNVNQVDDQVGDEEQTLDIFIDTRGPQVEEVNITGEEAYDLFNPKGGDDPDEGPTPLVWSLDIDLIDQPVRVNGVLNFVYPAANEILATTPGNIQIVGDANGVIPIESIDFLDYTVAGDVGKTTIRLHFFDPLPDDRFTLTVSDRIKDDAGNALDGESKAAEPQDDLSLPSGDGDPGEDFVARFTVDSRPEVGTWSAGSVYVDTNGNFHFDPENVDYTNRDLVYVLGFTTDYIFAGNFALGANDTADGFDKLAAYGKVGGQARWMVDTDNNGVPNVVKDDPANIIGHPFAGNFDLGNPNNVENGDEVGVFDGTTWWLDTTHDFNVDTAISFPGMTLGFPIAGDFDGNGLDDLGTFQPADIGNGGVFTFALRDTATTWFPLQTIDFQYQDFIGVRERPVAADMDGDGIDDVGLWVPDRSGATPWETGEWYFLLSADLGGTKRIEGQVNTLDHHFSPIPLGEDLFAQFGDEFAVPVVGNFDPPVAGEGVASDPTVVSLLGTSGDDVLEFKPGPTPDTWTVTVNGFAQNAASDSGIAVEFDGLEGKDTVIVTGTAAVDTAKLWPHRGTVVGEGYTVGFDNVDSVTVHGGGGEDVADLRGDPAGKDTYHAWPDEAKLFGDGFINRVVAFPWVHAFSTAGNQDMAVLHDDPDGTDVFRFWPEQAKLYGDGFFTRAKGFWQVHAFSSPGNDDMAVLYDNPHDVDTFKFYPGEAKLFGVGFYNRAKGFSQVHAFSEGDDDVAILYDDPDGDEVFKAWPEQAKLYGDGFFNRAKGFRSVYAYARGGDDVAHLYGSGAQDTLVATAEQARMFNSEYFNRASSFDRVYAHGADDVDTAILYDAVLESGITSAPAGVESILWLYEFEEIQQRNADDEAESTTEAVDEMFLAYWP